MIPLPPRVLLASQSPRRRELLAQIGIDALVEPADIDESAIRDPDPERLARVLAEEKARTVAKRIGPAPPDHLAGLPVIAADTVVALDHHILEKPQDESDARRMMEILSGRTHEVITGIAVIMPEPGGAASPGRRPVVHASVSRVTLSLFSNRELDEYLESEEWRGVAGAYRIQGIAARYVEHLEGSYSNVVGLPLHLVYAILTAQLT